MNENIDLIPDSINFAKLWLAVILRAAHDLCLDPKIDANEDGSALKTLTSYGEQDFRKSLAKDATDFFENKTGMFELCCKLINQFGIDINYSYIRNLYKTESKKIFIKHLTLLLKRSDTNDYKRVFNGETSKDSIRELPEFQVSGQGEINTQCGGCSEVYQGSSLQETEVQGIESDRHVGTVSDEVRKLARERAGLRTVGETWPDESITLIRSGGTR